MSRYVYQQLPSPDPKFPFVGPRYHGDKPGWIYNPYDDAYHPDPKAQQEMLYATGAAERPKTQSMTDILLPLAAVTGTGALAQQIGKGGLPAIQGLLGLGGGGGGAATTTGTGGGSGLLGMLGLGGGGTAGAGELAAPSLLSAAPTAYTGIGPVASGSEYAGLLGQSGAGATSGMGSYVLPGIGIAAGGYGLYNTLKGLNAQSKSRGALGGAASGAALGAGIGSIVPGIGTLIGSGVGALAGGLLGLASHESTKAAQKRRWGGLSEGAQGLMQANHPDNDTGKWSTGKYAGQDWTFEKALDLAKEDPTHFQGVYGNMAALGDKYFGLTDAQQKDFVRRNIEAGNYASKKGDVILQDQAKANEIYNQILNPQEVKK